MGISDPMFSGDVNQRITALERQLRNLTSGRRLEDASIGARGVRIFGGGTLTVEGGGDIIVDDEGDIIITGGKLVARDINGETVFAVDTADPASVEMNLGSAGGINVTGGASIALNDGGGINVNGGTFRMFSETGHGLVLIGTILQGTDESRGFIFSFDNGDSSSTAFSLAGAPGSQFWSLRDNANNIVVSNDAASGNGLARPYLNIPMYPSVASTHQTAGPFWPATNSTSYVELFHGFTTMWHPRLTFGMDTTASGGSTEWRLLISGALIASGSGDTQGTYSIPGWGSSILPGHEKVIQVEVRNTTGSVSWCQVDKCYGTQS